VEISDSVGLGFEVLTIGIGQNEIENQQSGSDDFLRQLSAIAQVVFVIRSVNVALEEMKNQSLIAVFFGCRVPLGQSPGSKTMDKAALALLGIA
jgi:hypothetical protein